MFLRIHVPGSSAEHSGDPSIERVKDDLGVMCFLDADLFSQAWRSGHPNRESYPFDNLDQDAHRTESWCSTNKTRNAGTVRDWMSESREVFIDDQLIRIAVRRGIFRSA